jgi:hypothetical protein
MQSLKPLFVRPPFAVLAFLIAFNSCSQKPAQEKSSVKNPVPDYQAFVDGLDGADVTQVSVALSKYKVLFDGQDPRISDQGFVTFYNFYSNLEINLNDRSGENLEGFDSLTLLASPANDSKLSKRLATMKQNLENNGYQVVVAEGYASYRQVPEFMSTFDRYLSEPMKNYRSQMAKEYNEPVAVDGSPAISGEELAKRILWWYKFLENNPAFPFQEQCDEQKKFYMNTIVRGTDNALLVDENKIEMSPFFEKAYTTLFQSESAIGTRLKPYYDALKAKNIVTVKSIQQRLQDEGLIY